MNGMLNKLFMIAAATVTLCASGAAMAQGHAYLNYMRSGTESHIFVQQTIEGEYGQYKTEGSAKDAAGNDVGVSGKQFWKGYGFGTTIGLELMKFVEFTAGHTFVNMRYKEDALESLAGSRLHAGVRFAFLSPVGNLEVGGGFQGSRLDYQKQLDNASFYGSGYYYGIGVNYFLSQRVSVVFDAKMTREHLDRSGGSSVVRSIDTDATLMGAGFRIWL